MAKKKKRKKFSGDGFLMACPTCDGQGERLFPDPPDIPELGTSRLPSNSIIICPRCNGVGTVWNYPK